MKIALLVLLGLAGCLLHPAAAHAAACPAPPNGSGVSVPGKPFGMAVSRDGCWMFVSMLTGRQRGALAVLHDAGGSYSVARIVTLAGQGTGDTLTHDGRLLVVAEGNDVAVFDASALEQASGNALMGRLHDGYRPGMVYVLTSLDDRLLFVSDEDANAISVFDLAKWRADGFKRNPLVGRIPTGLAPVGLALSPDGKWLYSTSEVAPWRWGFQASCTPEIASERAHPQGFLLRIKVAMAARNPRASLAGGMQAGCNPVRVAAAPDGADVWVTARGSKTVLRIAADAFATKQQVRVASFDVGGGPVGIAVRPDGKQVWIALANRFGNTKYNPEGREIVGLLGIDTPGVDSVKAVSEPASAFPRELMFLPDGRTFAVGLFAAGRIEFFTTPP